jgi:CCR4-NOT transcription complex subunit 6
MAPLESNHPTALFTVMCYNVLCDRYATRQQYGYCPQWALNWEYRKKGILDEVRHYGADIVTLQEVETDQFYNFFLPELKREGYEGIFSPKSRAKTMSELDRKHVDGCAIFWRLTKFSLIKEHLVEFNQVAMANAEGSDVMLNRVMTKDNIALAALLETKEQCWENGVPTDQVNQPLLVATAHIHWDPEFCDVKLIQTMMLIDQLKRICDDSSGTGDQLHSFRPSGHKVYDRNSIQLLLCGDFNSLPESGVVEYLQNGRIRADHVDFKDLLYKSTLQKMLSHSTNEQHYTHPFKLSSVFDKNIMPYTNYTYDFKGMIDYIFYPKESMRPLGFLGPISEDWLKENKVVGCPHPHITSDHFSLLVELGMSPSQVSSNSSISMKGGQR